MLGRGEFVIVLMFVIKRWRVYIRGKDVVRLMNMVMIMICGI